MNRYYRDIILVINDEGIRPGLANSKVDFLNDIIAHVDNIDGFCTAHELVNRYRITSKRSKILEAARNEKLKPFRFLINKN